MLRKAFITLILTLASPVFAEESFGSFLDELEALAELQATNVLGQSVVEYYAKNTDIDQGKYPTLLHDAAIIGTLKLLEYLVKHDSHDVNFPYQGGPTPLGYIAGDNQIGSAKILLNAGADPNDMGDTDGIYPLSSAVTSGNMKMIQLLLEHGAKVHIGAYYQSPLGITLEKNDIETLQLFSTYGFQLDSMDDELRIIVVEYLNSDFVEEEVLRILKTHGFDIYAKTKEKASFFTEYGDKIEESDVKKMLQDLYETDSEVEPVKAVKAEDSGLLSDAISDNTSDDVTVEPIVNTSSEDIETETSTAEISEELDNKDNMLENTGVTNLTDTVESNANLVSEDMVIDNINTDEATTSDSVPASNKNINSTEN